jgi:hypothetical protein
MSDDRKATMSQLFNYGNQEEQQPSVANHEQPAQPLQQIDAGPQSGQNQQLYPPVQQPYLQQIPTQPIYVQPGGQFPVLQQKIFNRGFFDRKDPLENAGTYLNNFSVTYSCPVEQKHHWKVLTELYNSVQDKVVKGNIPGATRELVDYKDAKTSHNEPPRHYIIVSLNTVRGFKMSVYANFLTYGDNLFISINSVVLGPLDKVAFLINLFFNTIFSITVVGLAYYLDIIRGMSQGEPLSLIFRKKHPKAHNLGLFNTDDILMFYKSVVPMIMRSVQEVFENNNIPVDVLEKHIQNINYVTNVNDSSTNISGGISGIISGVIGGTNNQASVGK